MPSMRLEQVYGCTSTRKGVQIQGIPVLTLDKMDRRRGLAVLNKRLDFDLAVLAT